MPQKVFDLMVLNACFHDDTTKIEKNVATLQPLEQDQFFFSKDAEHLVYIYIII